MYYFLIHQSFFVLTYITAVLYAMLCNTVTFHKGTWLSFGSSEIAIILLNNIFLMNLAVLSSANTLQINNLMSIALSNTGDSIGKVLELPQSWPKPLISSLKHISWAVISCSHFHSHWVHWHFLPLANHCCHFHATHLSHRKCGRQEWRGWNGLFIIIAN